MAHPFRTAMSTATLRHSSVFSSLMEDLSSVRQRTSHAQRPSHKHGSLLLRAVTYREMGKLLRELDDIIDQCQQPEIAKALEQAADDDIARLTAKFAKTSKDLCRVAARFPNRQTLLDRFFARRGDQLRAAADKLATYEAVFSRPKGARIVLSARQQENLSRSLDSPREPSEALKRFLASR